MTDPTIRLYVLNEEGHPEDASIEYSLTDFAGFVPSIGDRILNPSVPSGWNRSHPLSREMWTVVGRVFNPRDLSNYIALIVRVDKKAGADTVFIP